MISPQAIASKAERVYERAISAWLEADETFFPYRLKCDLSLPDSQSELIQQVETLRKESKENRGFGYSITWEEKAKRQYGRNRYPVAICFDSLEDLVKLVRKSTEFRTLQNCVEKVRRAFPQLNEWIAKNWQRLLEVESQLDQLLAVVQYMIDHPRPDCFTRELPLAISTKLIEQHRRLLSSWFDRLLPEGAIDFGVTRSFEQKYGFRFARPHLMVRFLDAELAREVGSPWLELSLPVDEIAKLPMRDAFVFVVENKVNLVNLLTLPHTPRGLALGGLGYAVCSLESVSWLAQQTLYYWGDMDLDGFAILSAIRYRFPQTRSLFMDIATLEQHIALAVSVSNQDKPEPDNLTSAELAAFQLCKAKNLRLEQEHISQALVNQRFVELQLELG